MTILATFEEIDLMSKKQKNKLYSKIKLRTENTINKTGKTVGAYIYDALLQKPNQKIKGNLVRVIERRFYTEELNQILAHQASA